jgi:hypothetical protein
MTTYETAEAMLDLYQLRELPSPSEFDLVETQVGRVATMMETRAESQLLEIGVAYEAAAGFKRRMSALSAAPSTVEGV